MIGTGCQNAGRRDDRPEVATVDGVPLYLEDFERAYQWMSLSSEEGLPRTTSVVVHRRAVLNDLIDRRLILRAAEERNVMVGIDETEAALVRLRSGWSEEEFRSTVRGKDLTETELKRELRDLAMISKFFRDHVYARVAVTDTEIEGVLEARPELATAPEQVRARHIVVKTEDEAKKIHRELRRGGSFVDAAMQHSLSPEGTGGGDLGFFARGEMPRVFDEVCFNLGVGETSKVVASDYGFHIFKVIERRPAHAVPLAQVRERVERELRKTKEQAAHRAMLKTLRGAATIVVKEKQLARM